MTPATRLRRELRDMGLTPQQASYLCHISPRRMEALCEGATVLQSDANALGRLTGISPGVWMQAQFDAHMVEHIGRFGYN